MINNVTLVGRLTKTPELRYTNQNTAVTSFTIAVNRRFKNAAGEREADFINCVIWRQSAENLAAWANKGSLIGVVGSIQTRNYENQQGQRIYVTEVVVDNFQLLESKSQRTSQLNINQQDVNLERSTQSQSVNQAQEQNDQSRFSNHQPNNGQNQKHIPYGEPSSFSNQGGIQISDDDLPF